MDKNRLKTIIERRYGSVGGLSCALGVARPMGYEILKGRGSRRGRVFLARELGRPPSELWPHNSKLVKYLDDEEYKEAVPCAVVRN